MSPLRSALVCATLVCAALMAATSQGAIASGSSVAATGARADTPATRLINAEQLRSELLSRRGKVVVLNLWATWCAPCLREIPSLLTVAHELAPRGVVLIGVAMDEPQALSSQVEPFRLKFFPGFLSWLRAEPDTDSIASVVDQTWNEILPTTYIIGRDGKLRTKIQGGRSEAQFREAINAVLTAP